MLRSYTGGATSHNAAGITGKVGRISAMNREISELLQELHKAIDDDREGELPLGWRIALWSAMADTFGAEAQLRRNVLAFVVARDLMPIWNRGQLTCGPLRYDLFFQYPANSLAVCRRYLRGELPLETVERQSGGTKRPRTPTVDRKFARRFLEKWSGVRLIIGPRGRPCIWSETTSTIQPQRRLPDAASSGTSGFVTAFPRFLVRWSGVSLFLMNSERRATDLPK